MTGIFDAVAGCLSGRQCGTGPFQYLYCCLSPDTHTGRRKKSETIVPETILPEWAMEPRPFFGRVRKYYRPIFRSFFPFPQLLSKRTASTTMASNAEQDRKHSGREPFRAPRIARHTRTSVQRTVRAADPASLCTADWRPGDFFSGDFAMVDSSYQATG